MEALFAVILICLGVAFYFPPAIIGKDKRNANRNLRSELIPRVDRDWLGSRASLVRFGRKPRSEHGSTCNPVCASIPVSALSCACGAGCARLPQLRRPIHSSRAARQRQKVPRLRGARQA